MEFVDEKAKKKMVSKYRTKVIGTSITLIIVLLLMVFFVNGNIEIKRNFDALLYLVLFIHAGFCSKLYYTMKGKATGAVVVFVLTIVSTWFFYGIGLLFLTLYLLIKSNDGTARFTSNMFSSLPLQDKDRKNE